MEQKGTVIEGRELADMRLMAFLREQVSDHGRKKAAAILGVDRRTLDAGLEDGVLSRRMRAALDRAIQYDVGSPAVEQRERNERLEERLTDMEGAVDGLTKEVRRRLAAIEEEVAELRRDDAQRARVGHAGAGPFHAEVCVSGKDGQSRVQAKVRREHPDLVTREAADDDGEVFGDAWPLIVEWREVKNTHPIDGKGLGWLAAQERLLVLELDSLEEHGMTLPPEKQPLRGLDRSGQTSWRRSALSDTKRERKKVKLLNRLTFKLLWR